ncbi:hypothetical protein CSHISOI_08561, partial [Colletotrichum shisoi]
MLTSRDVTSGALPEFFDAFPVRLSVRPSSMPSWNRDGFVKPRDETNSCGYALPVLSVPARKGFFASALLQSHLVPVDSIRLRDTHKDKDARRATPDERDSEPATGQVCSGGDSKDSDTAKQEAWHARSSALSVSCLSLSLSFFHSLLFRRVHGPGLRCLL